MNDQALADHILDLEKEMHRNETRQDSARMAELLHEQFREFGRSGRSFTRQEILEECQLEAALPKIGVENESCNRIDQNTILLTYTSFHLHQTDSGVQKSRFSLRSSLWVHMNDSWRLYFHQGTAVPDKVAHTD